MRIILKTCLILLASLSLNQKAYSQVTTDFDQDGKSDYTIVSIGTDKVLSWTSINSSNNAENSMGTLGDSSNHIAMAPWKGSGKAQIGVIGLSDNKKELVWKIKNDEGTVEERDFGKSNYSAIAGGDFDGNGKADAAVAYLKQKVVQWQISFDMFDKLVGQESVSTINFGQAGDRVFFAKPDGVSDHLGTVGKGVGGKGVLLRLKSLKTGAVTSSTKFPKYIVKGTRPRPFPVKNAEGKDYLAFARVVGKNTVVDIRTVDGLQIAQVKFSGKNDVVAGNFTDDAGEEVATKTSTGYAVFSPVSKLTTQISAKDGIAVDEVNVNTFTASNNGGGGSGDGDNGSPPASGNSSCSSVVSWPSSHIYKSIGSDHFTDIRRNTSGIIIKPGGRGPFPTCVDIVDIKGNVVAKMGRYAIGEYLWAARFYAGFNCGSSTAFNGATIASRAAASSGGSRYVYANFGSVCYGPIDPARCIGSKSC